MRPSWTVVHWGTFLQKPTLSGVYFYSGNTCFEYFKAKITCMRSFCSSWPCHTMKTSGAGQATEERAKWRLSLLGHTCLVKKKKKKQDWSQLAPSLLSGSQPTPGATSPPNSTIINTNQAFNPGIKVETQINWVSKLRKSNQDEQLHSAPGAQAVPPGHDVPGGSVPPEVSHPPCLAAGSFIYFSLSGAPPGPCSPARGGPVAGLGREAAPRGAPGGAALTPSRCAAAAGPVSVCVCACLSVSVPVPVLAHGRGGAGGGAEAAAQGALRGSEGQAAPRQRAAAGGRHARHPHHLQHERAQVRGGGLQPARRVRGPALRPRAGACGLPRPWRAFPSAWWW